MMKDKLIALLFAAMLAISAKAQVGEHRNEFSVGVTGGCVLSNVGFTPTVQYYLQHSNGSELCSNGLEGRNT